MPSGGNRSQVFYFVINTQRVALLLYLKVFNVLARVTVYTIASAEDHFHSFILFSLTSNNPMLAAIDSFFQKGHQVKEKKKKTNFSSFLFNGMCRQQHTTNAEGLTTFQNQSLRPFVCVACRRSFVRSGRTCALTHTLTFSFFEKRERTFFLLLTCFII